MSGYFQQQGPWPAAASAISSSRSEDNGIAAYFNDLYQRKLLQQHAQQLQFENQMKMKEFGLETQRLGIEQQKLQPGLDYQKQLGLQAGAETAKTSEEVSRMQRSRQQAETIGLLSTLSKRMQIQPESPAPGSPVMDPAAQAIRDSGPLLSQAGLAGSQPQDMTRSQFAQLINAAIEGKLKEIASQAPAEAGAMVIQPEKQQMMMEMLQHRLASAEGMNDTRLVQRESEMAQKGQQFQQGETDKGNRTLAVVAGQASRGTLEDAEAARTAAEGYIRGGPVAQGNNTGGVRVVKITRPDGTIIQPQQAAPVTAPVASPEESVKSPPEEPDEVPVWPAIPTIPSTQVKPSAPAGSVTKGMINNRVSGALSGQPMAKIRSPVTPGEVIPPDQKAWYLNWSKGNEEVAKKLAATDGWTWQ